MRPMDKETAHGNFRHLFYKLTYEVNIATYPERRQIILEEFKKLHEIFSKGAVFSQRRFSVIKARQLDLNSIELSCKSKWIVRVYRNELPLFRSWLISEGVKINGIPK